jgi:hypothetical protein
MDFSIQRLSNGFRAISAKGKIVDGDAERLRIALQSADRDENGQKGILLDSPGGLVSEALAMAALMDREKNVSTWVLPDAECASACAAIVFVSGNYRIVFDGGKLGIHSCSLGGTRDELCNDEIAQNAFKHGVSYGAVMAYMVQRGPSEMAWLSSWEADCWGLTLWPPTYHRGTKRGEVSPCMKMALQCGLWKQSVSTVTNCVVQKFDTWRKTQIRSLLDKNCEESATKLAYPRKLNECSDLTSDCKKLIEDWMNEAAQLKRHCLNKK